MRPRALAPWVPLCVIAAALGCAVSALAQGEPAKADSPEPRPMLQAEAQVEADSKRPDRLKAELDVLNREKVKVDTFMDALNSLKFDAGQKVDDAIKKLQSLRADGKAVSAEILKGDWPNVSSALGDILAAMFPPLLDHTPSPKATGNPLLEDIAASMDPTLTGTSTFSKEQLEQVKQLQNLKQRKVKDTRFEVVSGFDAKAAGDIFRQAVNARKQFLQGYLAGLNKSIASRQAEQHRLAEEAKLLEARGQRDNNLTYAIYAMIFVVFALFVVFSFFRAEVQGKIIESRMLVELLGLAFLMLTIIILGTGERIDRAVLGTLLGTIAGYVFGQQSRSMERRRPVHEEADKQGPQTGEQAK